MQITPAELRRAMNDARISSAAIGSALGVDPGSVRRWRNGSRPIPENYLPALTALLEKPSLAGPPRPLPAIVAAIRERAAPRPRISRRERAHIRAVARAIEPGAAKPRRERAARRRVRRPSSGPNLVELRAATAAHLAELAERPPAPAIPWQITMLPGTIAPLPAGQRAARCAFREERAGTVHTCAAIPLPGGRFCAAHS